MLDKNFGFSKKNRSLSYGTLSDCPFGIFKLFLLKANMKRNLLESCIFGATLNSWNLIAHLCNI